MKRLIHSLKRSITVTISDSAVVDSKPPVSWSLGNSDQIVRRDHDHVALRPQKRGGLLGTGTGGGGWGGRGRESKGSTADTVLKRPERPWTNRSVKAVSPRHCPATSALRSCCFNCRAGQSHKDNVRCTAAEEETEAKEGQLSQPSSTSLIMISSGLT